MTVENNGSVETTATENKGADAENTQTEVKQLESETPESEKPEGGAEPEGEQEQQKPKKSRAQERIQQLAREKAEMAAELAEYKAKAAQPQTKAERPNIADYENVEDYYSDLDDYLVSRAEERIHDAREKTKASETEREKQITFESAMIAISEEISDFDVVVTAGIDRQLPMPVTLDEVAAEFGYDTNTQLKLLYELAKDEAFHEQVSSSPKLKAARLLSERVESWDKKPAPQVSKAPPPINPIKASATAARSPESMSDDEWYQEQTKLRKGK